MLRAISCSVLTILIVARSVPGDPPPASQPTTATAPAGDLPGYTWNDDHDPNGIGKFYMGREIAQVMGHLGAEWLDRPEREREEQPAQLIAALDLRPGTVVADIGAGSGYFTLRLAKAVGPTGRVKAVDIQPEMLDIIKKKMEPLDLHNVDLILGTEDDPKLEPDSIDLVLLVDVYHEFEYPYEMMQRLVRALKPGGRIAFVEFRLEDPDVPIKHVHKMSKDQVIREARPHRLELHQAIDALPRQHVLIFRKPSPTSQPASRDS